ncbi:RNA polymerase II [Paraphysoderma sedebokerense]|nr:RNA polymerase II [Paraphysoderma sedebokerense]
MEIVKAEGPLLSNYEVLAFLKAQTGGRTSKESHDVPQNLKTIEIEVTNYLSSRPCFHQNSEQISAFIERFRKYELRKEEKLQILNLRPTVHSILYAIIEECEHRFTTEELEQMIADVKEILFIPAEQKGNDSIEG